MMRSFLKIVVVGIGMSVGELAAQTTIVPVRAGEHEDFTRIVFQIPEENTWILRQSTNSAEILIDGPPLRFDLAQTFARIPRTRLASVTSDANVLRLQIACDCDIRASNDLPNYLVIDISDTESPAGQASQPHLRPARRPDELAIPRVASLENARRAGSALARTLAEQSLPNDISASDEFRWLLNFPSSQPTFQLDESLDVAETQSQADPDFLSDLGRVIAQSVAGGKLQPNLDRSDSPDREALGPDRVAVSNFDLREHLSSLSAGVVSSEEPSDEPSRKICSYFQMISLVDDADVPSTRALRPSFGMIYDDRDQVQEIEVIAVMNQFLAKGFGAEARSVLRLLDVSEDFVDIIQSVSALVDLEKERARFDFSDYLHCSPDVHIWNFLSAADHLDSDSLAAKELVSAFKLMNPTLRSHFGPEISSRLSSNSGQSLAEIVQVNVERVAEPSDPRVVLSRAKIEASGQRAIGARTDDIERLISADLSDEALIFLFSQKLNSGQGVDDRLIEMAENRLLPHRNHPVEIELISLLAKGYAQRGDFKNAFRYVSDFSARMTSNDISSLRNFIFEHLVNEGDDISFIENTFSERPWLDKSLSGENRAMIAERLLDLGFGMQAGLFEALDAEEIEFIPAPFNDVRESSDRLRDMVVADGQLVTDGLEPETAEATNNSTSIVDQLNPQAHEDGGTNRTPGLLDGTPQLLSEVAPELQMEGSPTVEALTEILTPQRNLLSNSQELVESSFDLRLRLRDLLDTSYE